MTLIDTSGQWTFHSFPHTHTVHISRGSQTVLSHPLPCTISHISAAGDGRVYIIVTNGSIYELTVEENSAPHDAHRGDHQWCLSDVLAEAAEGRDVTVKQSLLHSYESSVVACCYDDCRLVCGCSDSSIFLISASSGGVDIKQVEAPRSPYQSLSSSFPTCIYTLSRDICPCYNALMKRLQLSQLYQYSRLILVGMSDGTVAYHQLLTPEYSAHISENASLSSSTLPLSPVSMSYSPIVRIFSQTPLISKTSVDIPSNVCRLRLCFVHTDRTLAVYSLFDSSPEFTFSSSLVGSRIMLPDGIDCKSISPFEGVLLYLNEGALTASYFIQQTGLCPLELSVPHVISPPHTKRILSFTLPSDRRSIVVVFHGGGIFDVPIPLVGNSESAMSSSPDMRKTTHQLNVQSARENILALQQAFNSCASRDVLTPGTVESVREVLGEISSAIKAEHTVLQYARRTEREILQLSSLLIMMERHAWPECLEASVNVEPRVYQHCTHAADREGFAGRITLSTKSISVVRALQGRAVRVTWRAGSHAPSSHDNPQSFKSFNSTALFLPSSDSSGNVSKHVCSFTVPLHISMPVSHYLDITFFIPNFKENSNYGYSDAGHVGTDLPWGTVDVGFGDILIAMKGQSEMSVQFLKSLPAPLQPSEESTLLASTRSASIRDVGNSLYSLSTPIPTRSDSHPALSSLSRTTTQLLSTIQSAVNSPTYAEGLKVANRVLSPRHTEQACMKQEISYSYSVSKSVVPTSAADVKSCDSIEIIRHKSNSRLLLCQIQTQLREHILSVLDREVDGHSEESSELNPLDSDIYSLPYDLQQVVAECEAIMRSIDTSRFYKSGSQSAAVEINRSGCTLSSNCLYTKAELEEKLEKLWQLYQFVRENTC